jgi:integrase/recombinase XerD
VSYVLYLQEQGKSASTIKTDLSAIRFFHDKISHPRYALPGNEELGIALERRRSGQIRSVRIGRQIRIPREALLEFLRK